MRTHKIKLIGAILLSSMVLLTFSSCKLTKIFQRSPKGSQTLAELPSVKQYQAPDVPVPANFEHQPDKSYAYITGNVRTTAIKYIGSARTDELLEFYRKQMPQFGWMEKMVLGVDSKKAIAFQKETEKCEIIIEQKYSDTNLLVKISYNK